MFDNRRQGDDDFAASVAGPLRDRPRFGDDFEQRLVAAIRADRASRRTRSRGTRPLSPAWWQSPIVTRLSPLEGLVMAASIAAIASLATLGLSRRGARQPMAAATAAASTAHDTITVVRFVFVGKASSVALVGDFNGWGAEPVRLSATNSDSAWAASVRVPRGRHEYAFIVDGQWVVDPFAPSSSDDFDTRSSIVDVGT